MNRQVIVSAVTGLAIGISGTSLLKNSQQNNELDTVTEAVKVLADVAKQYVDGYNRSNDHNTELFTLAKSYEEAKSTDEKVGIADSLVFKIREFNLPIAK
jgi:hypothetical protein